MSGTRSNLTRQTRAFSVDSRVTSSISKPSSLALWRDRTGAFSTLRTLALAIAILPALPLLWRDRVVGWANVSVQDGALSADLGYAAGAPPGHPAFASALDEELDRMSAFLGDRS